MTCTGAFSSRGNGDTGELGTKAGSCTGTITPRDCCDEQLGEPSPPEQVAFLGDPDWPGITGGLWSMSFGHDSGGDRGDDGSYGGGDGFIDAPSDDGGGDDGPGGHPGTASGTSGGGVVIH